MKKGEAILLIILAYGLGWLVGSHVLGSQTITILNIIVFGALTVRMWKD